MGKKATEGNVSIAYEKRFITEKNVQRYDANPEKTSYPILAGFRYAAWNYTRQKEYCLA